MVASAALAVSLIASAVLLYRLDRMGSAATLDDVLYVSSPKWVKRLSLGYTGLIADIYWTRAVQYFGSRHHAEATDYRLLYPLLNITTTLDPKLIVAYQFGAKFVSAAPPQGAGMPDKAVELVESGIRNNPDNWKLYYELGFIYYYMDPPEYAKASEAFERGAEVPNAHPFLRVLAAQMAQHAGEINTAQMLWEAAYSTTNEPNLRKNAIAHLRALGVDRDITELEKLEAVYQQKNGRMPSSFQDLIRAGLIPGVPVDPDHTPYRMMADGRIEVQNLNNFPFVKKGLPPGSKSGVPKLP